MSAKDLQYRLEHALFSGVRHRLLARPIERVRRFGHRLGTLAYYAVPGKRRLALRNLALVFPERSAAERRAIARQSFRNFGATACEILAAERFDAADLMRRFHIAGLEHLEAAAARGRGVCLMSAHFGCSELLAMPLAVRVGGMRLIARPPNNPYVAADLAAARTRFGNEQVDKRGALRRAVSALRRGGRVAILIDQRVREASGGIQVPFLGHPAWSTPILAFIALHTGAPVVPAFCVAEGDGEYRAFLRPPIEVEPGIDLAHLDKAAEKALQARLTERYLEAIAAEIRREPGQWLWMHHRWA